MNVVHRPVMTEQVLHWLNARTGARFLDATLGEGGHSLALATAVGQSGLVVGIDRDPSLVERTRTRLRAEAPQFQALRARFSFLREALAGLGIQQVDGVLFDLGLCSAQLDDGARGFSFQQSERSSPLDMRMDREHGESVAQLLARLDEKQLAEVLRLGGVPGPRRTAAVLLRKAPLRSVGDLLDAVEELRLPARRHHPATLVFQALRMAVNDEISELDAALQAARDVLVSGGRLVVLSYHSGEDGRVKRFLAQEARGCICPPALPVCGCGRSATLRTVCSGLAPTPEEVAQNPRARSARLRAGERL